MDYLIFARKFRPQTFDGILGQETITTTLKNAIKQGRVPQSFLFAGPRGVGKTSTARILAKALNCMKGLTEEPCGKCVACKEIEQGNSMDVLEIDGASNRGIEEIRGLRETVKFKPSSGRFKIYIIDEVHMLTTEAFNALLKTLEEPPPHVKFIFATTESHKVPLTILSRCQRFQFKRIPAPEVVTKLKEIAKKEKLKCDESTFFLIAKATEGALRDAESLLDQLASFSEGKIKEEDVLTLLGLASDEAYLKVLAAIHEKNGEEIFNLVKKIYEDGGDFAQFTKGLFEVFRDLSVIKMIPKGDSLIEAGEERVQNLKKKANNFSQNEVLFALSILQNLQYQLRRPIASPKLLVETALLKLLHLDSLRSVADLVQQGGVSAKSNSSMPVAPHPVSRPAEKKSKKPQVAEVEEVGDDDAEPYPAIVSKKDKSGGESSADGFGLDAVEKVWPQVIDYVKTKRMSVSLYLAESEPVEVEDSIIILGFPAEFKFHKETLEKENNRKLIEEAFQKALGAKLRVQFVITQQDSKIQNVSGGSDRSEESTADIVSQALEIFDGARIIRKE